MWQLTAGLELTPAVIYGGTSYEKQAQTVEAAADILIATPGAKQSLVQPAGTLPLACAAAATVQLTCLAQAG
jgi:superfamily II DNA/RNA helicase